MVSTDGDTVVDPDVFVARITRRRHLREAWRAVEAASGIALTFGALWLQAQKAWGAEPRVTEVPVLQGIGRLKALIALHG